MSLHVRVLIAAAATASLVAACGSGETAGSGTPAPLSSPAATPSASPSGNGVAALSAEELLGRTKAALAAAGYVRIKAPAEDAGSQITVEMCYRQDWAVGSFVLDGLRLDLRRVGDDVYLKAGPDFWTEIADAEVAELIAAGRSGRPPTTSGSWT